MQRMVLAVWMGLAAAAAWGQPVTVEEVLVIGVPAAEQQRLMSALPLSVGDVFPSHRALKRRATLVRSYLEQDGAYTGVTVQVEEFGPTEAGVYVMLQGASIGRLEALGQDLIVVPHFPVYATGLVLGVSGYHQYLGLDVPVARGLGVDVLAGHRQNARGVHALSAHGGVTWKPLPPLSFHVPLSVDLYLSGQPGGRWDAAVEGGAKLDLSYLAGAYLVGGSLEVTGRYGLVDYRYLEGELVAVLEFAPFSFLSFSATGTAILASGDPPPLGGVDAAARTALHVPPTSTVAGKALGTAVAAARVRMPLRLSLGIASLGFAIHGFCEGYVGYEAVANIAAGRGPSAAVFPSAVGGGLLLELGAPLSLTFGFGYGYAPAERRSAFLFTVN